MAAIAHDFWQELEDDRDVRIEGRIDPQVQDAYWQAVYWGEAYYRAEFDYDDYAPAYCVGYIGCAQYGGCFDDAEKSLCANWVRIKGDSRLTLDQAMQAIRAAWEHAALGQAAEEDAAEATVHPDAQPANQPQYATA
jgi:hypothetical protein